MGSPITPDTVRVVCVRATPAGVPNGTGQTDFFCVADDGVPDALIARGLNIVSLTDGWYADDRGGGVTVWGGGKHWETRETPFIVTLSSGPASAAANHLSSETPNIRDAILGSVP